MSTYAVGDIHGCRQELETLISILKRDANLSPDDTLIFVGDYVDRGPDSKGVIDYLLYLREHQNCIFLMGNHEDMMLWYLGVQHGRRRVSLTDTMRFGGAWIPNGGGKTLESYGIADLVEFSKTHQEPIPALREIIGPVHLDFLENLKYYHIEGSNLFVHAGVGWRAYEAETPEEAVEWSTDENLLWDREAFHRPLKFGTMWYGHTPSRQGVRWGIREDGFYYSVGLDVGTVFGANPLTAVRVEDLKEFK